MLIVRAPDGVQILWCMELLAAALRLCLPACLPVVVERG